MACFPASQTHWLLDMSEVILYEYKGQYIVYTLKPIFDTKLAKAETGKLLFSILGYRFTEEYYSTVCMGYRCYSYWRLPKWRYLHFGLLGLQVVQIEDIPPSTCRPAQGQLTVRGLEAGNGWFPVTLDDGS